MTVFLRRRWPMPITVASALAGIAVYLDTTVGLIAFTTVVRRARSLRDPLPWATGALLATGTLVSLFRDASQGSTGNSMIGAIVNASPDPGAVTHVSVMQVLFLAVVAMSLPVGVGLWLRARDGEKKARRRAQEAADASARAERAAQEQTRTSTRLADTVSLQAERERVAREVHDGLGHRLSLLALHAAALEQGVLETSESSNAPEGSQAPDSAGAVGEDDPRAAAQRVRQEAQGAMRDLRSLLAVLREPVGAVEPAPRLEDLREVVDGVLAAPPAAELLDLPRPRCAGRRGALARRLPDRPGVPDQRPQALARYERPAARRGWSGHRHRHHLLQPDLSDRAGGSHGRGQ
ncbi:histidine kinase [Actinomyces oris]|uniref:histidine kinase n=1 Tax=Actinomyces oris TaxID=544580 RepID=UPI0028EF7213|nr:histidine kinase [Actinomyces oris]